MRIATGEETDPLPINVVRTKPLKRWDAVAEARAKAMTPAQRTAIAKKTPQPNAGGSQVDKIIYFSYLVAYRRQQPIRASMDSVSAQKFLEDQVPFPARALIPTTLKSAYSAAALLVKQEPILQVASALDNGGRIVSWAIDLAFEKLLQSQQWPFDYRWREFAAPTGRYLEIRPSHSVITISQVSHPGKQPRNVVFRENGRFNNEPFFDLDEFRDERAIHGVPYFLLIHGHHGLNFAHLAVPHSVHRRDWIYRTPNLLNLPHPVRADVPPPESTDFEATMMLKEEIERWRKDHDA
jgi:hypothetical protein